MNPESAEKVSCHFPACRSGHPAGAGEGRSCKKAVKKFTEPLRYRFHGHFTQKIPGYLRQNWAGFSSNALANQQGNCYTKHVKKGIRR